MIYASLKSVQAWHTPLTPLCFLLFRWRAGCCSASFSCAAGGAACCCYLALARCLHRRRVVSQDRVAPPHATLRPLSTPETATGLGDHRQGAAVRASAYERQLSDPRNGLQDRPQTCREAARSFRSVGWGVPAAIALFLLVGDRRASDRAALAIGACWCWPRMYVGHVCRALAVLRRSAACGDELLRRLTASGAPFTRTGAAWRCGGVMFQRLWNHIHWPGSSRTQRSTTSFSSWAVALTSTRPSSVRGKVELRLRSSSRKRLPGRRMQRAG